MKTTHKAQLPLLGTLLGTALVILLLAVLAPESRAQSAWVIEVVDTASFLVGDTALALDAAGRPYVAYHSAVPSVVRYARKDGAADDQAHALATRTGTTQKTMPTLTPEPCAAILPLP